MQIIWVASCSLFMLKEKEKFIHNSHRDTHCTHGVLGRRVRDFKEKCVAVSRRSKACSSVMWLGRGGGATGTRWMFYFRGGQPLSGQRLNAAAGPARVGVATRVLDRIPNRRWGSTAALTAIHLRAAQLRSPSETLCLNQLHCFTCVCAPGNSHIEFAIFLPSSLSSHQSS